VALNMSSVKDIRRFRGRHLILMIVITGKHALIEHLEDGYVGGSKELGYKDVKKGERDITPPRLCWKIKKGII